LKKNLFSGFDRLEVKPVIRNDLEGRPTQVTRGNCPATLREVMDINYGMLSGA